MFHNMMLAGSLQGGDPRCYDHLPGVGATFAQQDLPVEISSKALGFA